MGKSVDPWWTVRIIRPGGPFSMRIYGLKLGPFECATYRLYKSGWHIYARFVGTRVITWMDGDCF